ncbi:MAG: biotin--[acetyl-CoA-carboxylase] ligase [Clostridia bacterium]|nr:biotin--[acetyl-CoA-carboxylase] ligase [Clostridia bacterium]
MQLKIEVLKILEEERGRDISGQALAERFGVSRNAVWKAVKALQAEGYKILAGQNKGYRLSDENDMLSAVGIADAIEHRVKGMSVYLHRTIDSTNNEAKRLIADGKTGTALIVAEGQTAGRGRRGREFFSPALTGIYMTFSFPSSMPLTDAVGITTATAVAVFLAIKDLTGVETEIKWVNDIYLHGKKICGILTEAISDFESGCVQHIIVGVGMNYQTADFPRELKGIAGSLSPVGVNRNRMIARIVDRLLDILNGDVDYLAIYRQHSLVLGKEIVYERDGVKHEARALDIDEEGGLVVAHADGSKTTLTSGEISLRLR